jgi:hypothetical protein
LLDPPLADPPLPLLPPLAVIPLPPEPFELPPLPEPPLPEGPPLLDAHAPRPRASAHESILKRTELEGDRTMEWSMCLAGERGRTEPGFEL